MIMMGQCCHDSDGDGDAYATAKATETETATAATETITTTLLTYYYYLCSIFNHNIQLIFIIYYYISHIRTSIYKVQQNINIFYDYDQQQIPQK